MSAPNQNAIAARLWKLPGQLLLALINATAILVIVAALLTLVAISRINNFAADVVATMTESALSKIDLPSRDVLANIRNLTDEVRTLGNSLREIRERENPAIQTEIARLREALSRLNTSVDRLTHARTIFTGEAVGRFGRSFGETVMEMRGCTVDASLPQHDNPSGDNAVARHAAGGR